MNQLFHELSCEKSVNRRISGILYTQTIVAASFRGRASAPPRQPFGSEKTINLGKKLKNVLNSIGSLA